MCVEICYDLLICTSCIKMIGIEIGLSFLIFFFQYVMNQFRS